VNITTVVDESDARIGRSSKQALGLQMLLLLFTKERIKFVLCDVCFVQTENSYSTSQSMSHNPQMPQNFSIFVLGKKQPFVSFMNICFRVGKWQRCQFCGV
jgi:hypothetical protein